MIRLDETATRSSRRRFYDMYTSPGDLLGKLRYPAGALFPSLFPEFFDSQPLETSDRSHTRWQLDQGPIRHTQRNHCSLYGSRCPERELTDPEPLP